MLTTNKVITMGDFNTGTLKSWRCTQWYFNKELQYHIKENTNLILLRDSQVSLIQHHHFGSKQGL